MKTFRVLSIDWDYFINATFIERNTLFPDGGNEHFMGELSDFVWSQRYADSIRIGKVNKTIKNIQNIDINRKNMETVISKINGKNYMFVSVFSHKWLGTLLLDRTNYPILPNNLDLNTVNFEIINIDHHSDLYGFGDNEREEMDCGNWLLKVFETYPNMKLTWIKNEDSPYDEINELPYKDNIKISTNIEDMSAADYNIVFLCRSDIWSPPHLDKYYGKLDRALRKRANNIVTTNTMPNRWEKVQKNMFNTIEQYEKFGFI